MSAIGAIGLVIAGAQVRRCSQLNPLTASQMPSTAQTAITPRSERFLDTDAPVTIAPERPWIRGYNGSASASVRRNSGALLESNTKNDTNTTGRNTALT